MRVEITYFKDTGKYYSEGEIDIDSDSFHDTVTTMVTMLNHGKRPGLIDGFDFNALLKVFTEHGPLYHLYVRKN